MTTIEKVIETRRLIDYASGLQLDDPDQLAELRLTNIQIKRLNDEVKEELAEKTPLWKQIKTNIAVYWKGATKSTLLYAVSSVAFIIIAKVIWSGVTYIWNLW